MKIERFLYVFLGFGGKKWLPCHFYHWSFYVEKTPVKLGNSGNKRGTFAVIRLG
jgi:hypothetical protein